MKKNELKLLKILAEIQNPDKIIEDMAKQLVFIAKERATDSDDNKEVEYYLAGYMEHLQKAIDKQFK